jgi:hypothetical protein
MNIYRNPNRRSLARRSVMSIGAFAALGSIFLTSGAGSASATDLPYWSTLVPSSDWLNVAVSGGSTSPGAPIIQWWADGGNEQQWHIPTDGTIGPIVNENSDMCVTTDGNAGDTLFQEPCSDAWNQQWLASIVVDGPQVYTNPGSGLVMDVSGYDLWAGGNIDAWYPNGDPNQYFWSSTGWTTS